MPIIMSYSCAVCRFDTNDLNRAQWHANHYTHEITIHGRITPQQQFREEISDAASRKLREQTILRRAREKGLVGSDT